MKRSKFSLSNYKLLSLDMGELVPVGLTEVLPGDTVQQATSALVRCSPLLTPVMHPVHVRIHHWFVPHRLVWSNWENFITGGPDGEDTSVMPTVNSGMDASFSVGSLADYLGLPPQVNNITASALPFRGYAMIFNEWYRDQDLVDPLPMVVTDGPDATTNRALQKAAWEKDYFTSSRPFEQKGPDITIPIGDEAPVVFPTGVPSRVTSVTRITGTGSPTSLGNLTSDVASPVPVRATGNNTTSGGDLRLDGIAPDPEDVYADLSAATPVSINELREAFALQRYQEARARYGSRYVEYLRYLGVRSSDSRLNRPEYLGGGRQTIQFSEVLQTAEGTTTPVGELRGHGITAVRSNRYRRFFEEHGYVFTFMSVLPKTIYAQGISRHWNRRTKEDYWQKELQHIGQQQILNKELYAAHEFPDAEFGYQDRYDEYRRTESTIAGEFRTSALNDWHLARIFGNEPSLDAEFVTSTPTKRVFASQSTDVLYVMVNHSIQARRMVAKSGSSFIF